MSRKTLRRRLQEARNADGVDQRLVERDYAQNYLLFGLGNTRSLQEALVFKGGTALKKIYFDQYRFSEDLDFSMVGGPQGRDLETAVCEAVDLAQQTAHETAPITFMVERYRERDPHPGGQEAFVVRTKFPWQHEPMVPVKIEVTYDEPVLLPALPRPVKHGYQESLEATIRTYSLEEISSEKIRATQQTLAKLTQRGWARPRARDFYDLWRLVNLMPGRIDWTQVSDILQRKCSLRDVQVVSVDDIFAERLIDEVRGSWNRSLGPFISELPDVDKVLTELRDRLSELLRF